MAQITMNIPDQHIPLILDSFALIYGYDANIHGTKAQFTKGKIRDYIKEVIARGELPKRTKTVSDTLQDEIDGIDIT